VEGDSDGGVDGSQAIDGYRHSRGAAVTDPDSLHHRLAASLLKESDRGAALIGAAFVDDALLRLLTALFRTDKSATKSMFGLNGPLSSLWAKAQLAYLLRATTTNTHREINSIRKIRNAFAHEWGPKDFNDATVANNLNDLIGLGDTRPGDDEEMRVGSQVLRRGEFIGRLAFVLQTARVVGRLDFVRSLITDGKDWRGMVVRMEETREW
jgi:hypothetical protein